MRHHSLSFLTPSTLGRAGRCLRCGASGDLEWWLTNECQAEPARSAFPMILTCVRRQAGPSVETGCVRCGRPVETSEAPWLVLCLRCWWEYNVEAPATKLVLYEDAVVGVVTAETPRKEAVPMKRDPTDDTAPECRAPHCETCDAPVPDGLGRTCCWQAPCECQEEAA